MGRTRHARVALLSLFLAETVTTTGSRMSFLAIPWLVLVTTGSPTRMGLVAGVAALTHVLSGVFGTPLMSRIGNRAASVVADAGCAVCMAAIGIFYHGRLGFTVLMVMVAVAGTLAGVGDRAKNVLLAPVAKQAGTPMPRVTAIFDGLNRTATIVGAALGGALIAWRGSITVIWVDAFSFLACGAIVWGLVRVHPAPDAEPEDAEKLEQPRKEPYFTALAAGVRHLRTDRLLLGIVTMMFVLNLFNQASAVVFVPLWVNEVLHSPVALGYVAGAFALGAIVGNVAFATLAMRLPRYLTLVIGYFIGGAPRFWILALNHQLPVVMAFTFVFGIATSSVNPTIGALLYQRVPAALQARVFGLCGAIAYSGLALGGLVGAWSVDGLGLTGGLVLAGAVYFTATLTPVVGYRLWRQIDDLTLPARREGRRDPMEALMSILSRVSATFSRTMRRLGLVRPDREDRIAPLTLTVAYRRDGWTVRARRGRRTVMRRSALSTSDALKKVAMLDVPRVYSEVEQIHAAELARAERRLQRLRTEIAAVEASLADLRQSR